MRDELALLQDLHEKAVFCGYVLVLLCFDMKPRLVDEVLYHLVGKRGNLYEPSHHRNYELHYFRTMKMAFVVDMMFGNLSLFASTYTLSLTN